MNETIVSTNALLIMSVLFESLGEFKAAARDTSELWLKRLSSLKPQAEALRNGKSVEDIMEESGFEEGSDEETTLRVFECAFYLLQIKNDCMASNPSSSGTVHQMFQEIVLRDYSLSIIFSVAAPELMADS